MPIYDLNETKRRLDTVLAPKQTMERSTKKELLRLLRAAREAITELEGGVEANHLVGVDTRTEIKRALQAHIANEPPIGVINRDIVNGALNLIRFLERRVAVWVLEYRQVKQRVSDPKNTEQTGRS